MTIPTKTDRFLEDASVYKQMESFWLQLWESLSPFRRFLDEWNQPWMANPLRDGNPIFSAVSIETRKAIRIIQLPDSDQGSDFLFWFDRFGGDDYSPDGLDELVIACILTEATAIEAHACIDNWLSGSIELFQPVEARVDTRGWRTSIPVSAMELSAA